MPKHEFYTPEQLSREWTRQTGQEVSIENIFRYGMDGNLMFMVANPDDNEVPDGELGDDYIEVWCEEFGQGVAKYFTITAIQLNHILSGNRLRLDSCIEMIDSKKVEYFLSPSISYAYDIASLIISKDEVIHFEDEHFNNSGQGLNQSNSKECETLPLWSDLFTKPPKKNTDVFSNIRGVVCKYIEEKKQLPNRLQLWERLKDDFKYNNESMVFEDISSKPMDKENFNSNFDRWAEMKLKGKTGQ